MSSVISPGGKVCKQGWGELTGAKSSKILEKSKRSSAFVSNLAPCKSPLAAFQREENLWNL